MYFIGATVIQGIANQKTILNSRSEEEKQDKMTINEICGDGCMQSVLQYTVKTMMIVK